MSNSDFVISASTERQLFIDDFIVSSMENLQRALHPVEKYPDNPTLLPVKPWEGQYTLLYGTVIRDQEEGVWKAWYLTLNQFRYIRNIYPESTYLCYAISQDGVQWQKLPVGVISYRGRKENNIVMQADNLLNPRISGILDAVSVLKDRQDPNPSRLYKMMIWHQNKRFVNGSWENNLTQPLPSGDYVAFSPDGLHWATNPTPAFTYDPVHDAMTTMWDPRAGKYIAFVKELVDGKRARFLSESTDFEHWSRPVQILAADAEDPPGVELYNNTGFYYEGMYLGLLTVLHPIPKPTVYLDVQLISSRDGRHWQRAGNRKPFIPAGRGDIDWDFGFQSPSSGSPVRVGDQLWFYYSGRCYRHPLPGQHREPNHGAIGMAKLRLDGFVSIDAGVDEGVLITQPMQFEEPALYVNADASKGYLLVEVLSEDGEPLSGFVKNDCNPISANGTYLPVHWWSANDLSRLLGRVIRLRFYLRNSSLYSFVFGAEQGV